MKFRFLDKADLVDENGIHHVFDVVQQEYIDSLKRDAEHARSYKRVMKAENDRLRSENDRLKRELARWHERFAEAYFEARAAISGKG